MWKPWCGPKYDGRKLLLLGESCYDWEDEDGALTKPKTNHPEQVVGWVKNGFPLANRFIDMLTRGICRNYAPSKAEVADAWDTVAFTNYVPLSVGVGPRIRPTEDVWEQADNEWALILNELRPRNIIVLGKTMWGYMPETQVVRSKNVQGYNLSDGSVAMCRAVAHPSGGLGWERLAEEIQLAERS